MKTITNEQLEKVGIALVALKKYEFFTIPAHRIRVAHRLLQPFIASFEEVANKVYAKYGTETSPGIYSIENAKVPAMNKEIDPLKKETVEIPDMKGIKQADLISAGARISPDSLDILEEIGFLTGVVDEDDSPK
jgi:hypothetical protein